MNCIVLNLEPGCGIFIPSGYCFHICYAMPDKPRPRGRQSKRRNFEPDVASAVSLPLFVRAGYMQLPPEVQHAIDANMREAASAPGPMWKDWAHCWTEFKRLCSTGDER